MIKFKNLLLSLGFLSAFTLWTFLLSVLDIKAIGPNGSSVGFSAINEMFHNFTGVNFTLYNITDWLGLVPVAFGFGFAIFGLIQWIKRKNILKVDANILLLGLYYIIVLAVYLLFEELVINYRPVLINGYLEASYPSSTTLLVMTVMPTTFMQMKLRIKNKNLKNIVCGLIIIFIAFMVIGRLVSGVHWLTDIIGGALLSAGLVYIYKFVCELR